MMILKTHLREVHQLRTKLYTTLARIFLQRISSEEEVLICFSDLHACFDLTNAILDIQNGIMLMRKWLTDMGNGESVQFISDLMLDYNRLFVGPGHLLAPPWESVYRSSDHLVFGKYTLEVREIYTKYGLSIPNKDREPEDHIGYELALIGVLAERSIERSQVLSELEFEDPWGKKHDKEGLVGSPLSWRNLLKEQHDFLNAHLCQWVDPFTSDVERFASTDFYKGVASLCRGVIMEDVRLTGEVNARQDTRWLKLVSEKGSY